MDARRDRAGEEWERTSREQKKELWAEKKKNSKLPLKLEGRWASATVVDLEKGGVRLSVICRGAVKTFVPERLTQGWVTG